MPGKHCCVINCSSVSHDCRGNRRNHLLQFFRFPKWKKHEGEHVSDVTRRRRTSWVAAIRRKDITFDHISQSMRVCSLHFHSGKPSYEMFENHPDWKPSLRLGHGDVKKTDEARYQRLVKRRTQHQVQLLLPQHQVQPPTPAQHPEPPSPAQECALCTCRRDVINSLLEENRKLKEELEEYRMNESFLSGDDNRVKYYTGFPNYVMFQTFLLSLTPYLPQGRLKKLSPFQIVLLTLIRLRLDLPIQHLGRLFQVHRTTASDAFHHTLSVMYSRLSPLVYWPSRESLLARVLAEKGFNIRDSVGMISAEVKVPTFTRGRAQLEAKDVEETRAVADLRIHVERVIGVVRNKFKFLHSTVPVNKLHNCEGENIMALDKVVTVCCALANMCESVVSHSQSQSDLLP